MGNYLKGETPSTIYKQLLSVGGSADRVGLTASLKDVWTDDGAGSKNLAPFQLSTAALSFSTTKQLQFRDTAIYLNSSTDGQLDIVADTEVQVTTAAFDVNASGAVTIDGSSVGVTGTTTLNSATTVSGALTCSSTTALNGITTLGSGIALRFADSGEYISGDGTNLTLGSGADINLTATSDINVPQDVGITFGDDGEKIEGDGTNLAVTSSGALNMTGAAASTWKTTSGLINIDSEDSTVEIDGHGGVNIVGNAAEVDITTTGALDLNSGAFTLDGAGISIDGTDDSNITVTGSSKDLSIAVVGGGTQQLTLASAGTGANAIDVEASAGGIDIRATGAASGEDIDITATGSSINLTSTENVSDAIVLNASAGGIDITSSGSAGEDIDISTSSSINLTSTENAANALYLRANGGTSETIKIHADQSTADKAIEIIADAGGVDIQAGKTGYGIKIGNETSGLPILLGHSTSEVTVGQNLTVTNNLTVNGTQSYSSLTVSHASATELILDNQEHSNGDGARDITIKFQGEKADSSQVDDQAQIVVAHDGTGDDQKGFIDFRTNTSGDGTSPTSALKLSANKAATFAGNTSVAATNKIYLDGGNDTYLHEVSADKLDVVVGGQTILEVAEGGGGASDSVAIQALNKLYLDGGGNTYIHESASDVVQMVVGGNVKFELDADSEFSQSNNDAGTSNTIFGKNAGDAIQSGGNYNTCVGENAGTAITTGDHITAIGYNAASATATGTNLTAIGSSAGTACTAAGTFIGYAAGQAVSTGGNNQFFGNQAGVLTDTGQGNIAMGTNALFSNTQADFSIAIGHNALYNSNRTADDSAWNTAVGAYAGNTITTGQQNTFVGYDTDGAATTSNQIAIGYSSVTTGQYGIAIGDNISAATNDAVMGKNGATITCDFDTDGTWGQASDVRKKRNIKDDTLGLAFINDLKTKTFQWKPAEEHPDEWKNYTVNKDGSKTYADINTETIMHGMIAQEVKESLDKVGCNTFGGWKVNENGQQELSKASFVVPLIKAVQELSKRVEELEKN